MPCLGPQVHTSTSSEALHGKNNHTGKESKAMMLWMFLDWIR